MSSNATTATRTRSTASIEAAISRANAKAFEQARAGNVPALLTSDVTAAATRQTWAVSSRTVAGVVYVVDLVADSAGVSTHCQCEAQHAGRICWHRSATRAALFGDIGHHDARGWHHAGPEDLADLLGWWAQQPAPDPVPDPAEPADWTAVAS